MKFSKEDIAEIKKLYTQERKTMKDIANKFGNVSISTINRLLHKEGVEIRSKNEDHVHALHAPSPFKEEVKDIQKLIELYNKCIPIKEIQKQMDCGRRAIERKVKELGLIRPKSMMSRTQYDSKNDEQIITLYNEGHSPNQISEIIGLSRASVKNHLKHCGIELRDISKGLFNYNNKEFPSDLEHFETLYDMYVSQRLSKKEISFNLNVSPKVVDRKLKEFGIHVRNSSESKYGLSAGSKHPNWKGGRTDLYARLREVFTTRLVPQVLRRDKYVCQRCGTTKKLQVHHIKHFKDIFNEILAEHPELNFEKDKDKIYEIMVEDKRMNDLENLITYCKDCHLYKIHGYNKSNKHK